MRRRRAPSAVRRRVSTIDSSAGLQDAHVDEAIRVLTSDSRDAGLLLLTATSTTRRAWHRCLSRRRSMA